MAPSTPRLLGFAGLLPQLAAGYILLENNNDWRFTALAMAYAYAALIFSFLGGVWWGIGIARPESPRWIYLAAVTPSLIGLALWAPWMLGWTWPGPELMVLGVCFALSPLIDWRIGRKLEGLPEGWMALRRNLSIGLGTLTVLIGLLAG
jgi:Protein of unknown function (DUF3429)